jgi:hypothetical protein
MFYASLNVHVAAIPLPRGMKGRHVMKQLIVLLGAGLIFIAFGCGAETQSAEDFGELSLELIVGDGVQIDEVAWEITNVDYSESGVFDVSADGRTPSIDVFGLPAGSGYVMTMEAVSDNGEVSCSGSASFDVEVGTATYVAVLLNCRLPTEFGAAHAVGDLNVCPELTNVMVYPTAAPSGAGADSEIELEATAVDVDGDTISYDWYVTGSGVITSPTSASTNYLCVPGNHEITIRVTDWTGFDDCTASWTVPVTCGP